MRVSKVAKQHKTWHQVTLFTGLGLFALWSLSLFDAPQLGPVQSSSVSPGAGRDVSSGHVDPHEITRSKNRLLLSTHNRLFWYYPETDEDVPLHSGRVRPLLFYSRAAHSTPVQASEAKCNSIGCLLWSISG